MEVRRSFRLSERMNYVPWWVYLSVLPLFYLLGWALRLWGIIPVL